MGEKLDLKFRHVVWPTFLEIILLSVCVLILDENKYPPVIISLILMIAFSPLLAHLTRSGNKREHAIGVGIVCVPVAGLWIVGPNYFNVAIPFLVWVWLCASWSKKEHPPFRYGIWHGFGIASSILPGSILIGALLQ